MKKNRKFKIVGVAGACASLSSMAFFMTDTKISKEMNLIQEVEAQSTDYVEPYVETEVAGVTNSQSEVLEDGAKVVSSSKNSSSTTTQEPQSTVITNLETVKEKAPVAINKETEVVEEVKPVAIEYVSRSTFTGVVPNEMNEIIIAMYHGVLDNVSYSETVHRSISGFKRDLQLLYDNGYRAITMEDLMSNNISVTAGYTPIVLTFDDGLSSQLSMEYDSKGELVVKKDTAVDIINEFNKTHPDFGTHAMFYVYTSQRPFKGAGTYAECAEYLLANGYELGAHTYSHAYLDRLSSDDIQMQLAYNAAGVAKEVDDFYSSDVKYLAYPYGVSPSDWERRQYLLEGSYEVFKYNFHSSVLAAPNLNTSTLIYSNSFDPLRVGRYRGTNNATMDLNWKVNKDSTTGKSFISDGDPNVVTILQKDFDKINLDTLNNKTLRVITD